MPAVDSLIARRFDELATRVGEILAQREFAFEGDLGGKYYTVDIPASHAWATSALGLVQRVFGIESVHAVHLQERYRAFRKYDSELAQAAAIFGAAKEDYEGGYLFTIRGLVRAEANQDILVQAAALLDAGHKDPACVVAGVALEQSIKELAARFGVEMAKADRLNAELCKKGAYNIAKQKQLTAWLDLRNRAAHGEWNSYSAPDVKDLISGVERFVGDFL